MSAITLSAATTVVDAAAAKAREIGQPMNIAVVDDGGHLVAFARMDGAIKASIDIVKANFVPALLTWLITLVIVGVGALLCGIGLLVAAPVAALFLVHAYRKLTGGQVAPLTP